MKIQFLQTTRKLFCLESTDGLTKQLFTFNFTFKISIVFGFTLISYLIKRLRFKIMKIRQYFIDSRTKQQIPSILQYKCIWFIIIVIMFERVASYKRKRQSLQKNHRKHNFIIYDPDQKLQQHCRICRLSNNLIAVCECNFRYHEKCLLNFIKHEMKKALINDSVFYASSIKCPSPHCQKQIHFLHQERNRYGCQYYCEKLSQNTCNKYLILILVLFLILGAFLFLAIYLSRDMQNTVTFALFCAYSLLSFIIGIVIVGALIVCFTRYFQVRQIFLKSIVRPKAGRSTDGGSSSSSQENKIYENISQNFEIYVGD